MNKVPDIPDAPTGPTLAQVERALERCEAIAPSVEAHCTMERLLRYLTALADMPAPSGMSALMRGPVVHRLLAADGILGRGSIRLDQDYEGTGTVALTAGPTSGPGLWYVAHLDSISYLVQPAVSGRHPLVPYCYHLTESGERAARAFRYDLPSGTLVPYADGVLISEDAKPFFVSNDGSTLRPGDRVVPVAETSARGDGLLTGHFDNAGGVAAMAVAAPVVAEIGGNAFFAMPDEEEGPSATGSQSISRGTLRLLAAAPAPRLSVVIDMQQTAAEGNSGPENAGVPGAGAVLSEFSSRARGAVTPSSLYAAARAFTSGLSRLGVDVKETSNIYTSRSDDVAIMQRSGRIVLLGFPGADRHFDSASPSAHPDDLLSLCKALVYISILYEELEGEAG